jgi:hypothetical protein
MSFVALERGEVFIEKIMAPVVRCHHPARTTTAHSLATIPKLWACILEEKSNGMSGRLCEKKLNLLSKHAASLLSLSPKGWQFSDGGQT